MSWLTGVSDRKGQGPFFHLPLIPASLWPVHAICVASRAVCEHVCLCLYVSVSVCVNLYKSVLFVVFPRLCLSEIESTLSFALYFFSPPDVQCHHQPAYCWFLSPLGMGAGAQTRTLPG